MPELWADPGREAVSQMVKTVVNYGFELALFRVELFGWEERETLCHLCDMGLSLSSLEGGYHCLAGGGVSRKDGSFTSVHMWVVRSFNTGTFRIVNKSLFIRTWIYSKLMKVTRGKNDAFLYNLCLFFQIFLYVFTLLRSYLSTGFFFFPLKLYLNICSLLPSLSH